MKKIAAALLLILCLTVTACAGKNTTNPSGSAANTGAAPSGTQAPGGSAASPSASAGTADGAETPAEGETEGTTEAAVFVPKTPIFELVLITDGASLLGGQFNLTAWEALNAYAEENVLSHRVIRPAEVSTQGFLDAAKTVCEHGAKLVIMISGQAAEACEQAQALYPDVAFVLVNANPAAGRATSLNSRSGEVRYRTEEGAYLAGYCAAASGFRTAGIYAVAGEELSERNARGFLQGMNDYLAIGGEQAQAVMTFGEPGADDAALQASMDELYNAGADIAFCAEPSLSSRAAAAAAGRALIVSDASLNAAYDGIQGVMTLSAKPAAAAAVQRFGAGTPEGGQVTYVGIKGGSVGFARSQGKLAALTEEQFIALRTEIGEGAHTVLTVEPGTGAPYDFAQIAVRNVPAEEPVTEAPAQTEAPAETEAPTEAPAETEAQTEAPAETEAPAQTEAPAAGA